MQRKLLMVSGKGGIGKSLTAASIAKVAASQGKTILLAESSACDQVGPLLGVSSVGHREVEVEPGLSVINLNPQVCFQEYVAKYLGQSKLFDKVFGNRLVKSLFDTIPGFGEIMMLGRLYFSAVIEGTYDLVVFDGPASGHFYNLLSTPQTVIGSKVGGPVVAELENIQKLFQDPEKSGVVWVTVPEELSLKETVDFATRVESEQLCQLALIVMNRVLIEHHCLEGMWQEKILQHRQYLEDFEARFGEILHPVSELGWIDEPLSLVAADQVVRGVRPL